MNFLIKLRLLKDCNKLLIVYNYIMKLLILILLITLAGCSKELVCKSDCPCNKCSKCECVIGKHCCSKECTCCH